jgi:hypothetical protein
MGVILQKATPRLIWFSRGVSGADLADVFGDGAFGEAIAQFPQFIAYALGTPSAIVECHAVDQGDHLFGNAGLPHFCFGLMPPKQAEALAMPTEEGVGLDQEQRSSPGA